MYIAEIELTNFKSYQHQIFEFPPISRDRHIVLIGGLNGYGKTSLLEALYLGLYGSDAIIHLGRAGLASKTYKKFLECSYYGAANPPSQKMAVRIDFQVNKNRGYSIRRSWYFNKDRSYDSEQVDLYPLEMGVTKSPISNDKINEILERDFVPAHLAPFFFFDGEEVKQIANQDKIEQVKKGMEGLLGIVILRKLSDSLLQFQNSQRSQVSNIDEEQLKKYEQKWKDGERSYTKLIDQISELKQDKAKIDIEFKEVSNRLVSIGGNSVDIASTKDLADKIHILSDEKEKLLEKLDQILSKELPLSLVRKELYQNLVEQLKKEEERHIWEVEKQNLSPKKNIFAEKYCEYAQDVMCKLDEEDKASLRISVDKAWRDLFYPPPDNCALHIYHDYMTTDDAQKVINRVGTKTISLNLIQSLNTKIDELNKGIAYNKNLLTKLEGISNDGTLEKLRTQLIDLQKQNEELVVLIRDKERDSIACKTDFETAKATYERMSKQLMEQSPTNTAISKAGRIRNLIDELIPRLYSIKTRQLSEYMTIIFKELSHKKTINEIKVLENGETHFYNNKEQEINFDRSAGEDQLFATTLLASLAKVSNIKAPLIVDTPLGRLDSIHRDNILKFWTSDKERQVILLSQDEEIRPDVLEKISMVVAKRYLLKYESIGDGFGRTEAIEGYFGE